MRLFLLICNFLALMFALTWLRLEWGLVVRDNYAPLFIFIPAVVLLALNVGYIGSTRTDQSVIKKASRFRNAFSKAWKDSSTEAQASTQHEQQSSRREV